MNSRIVDYAKTLVNQHLEPGGLAIDATAGAGNDTLLLANGVGGAGHVWCFDILPEALQRTRLVTTEAGLEDRVTLIPCSHEKMAEKIPKAAHGNISAIMFNLGYLPGGDHSIITTPDSTLPALQAAVALLKPGGILTVVLYRGHSGGLEESNKVFDWAKKLPSNQYSVMAFEVLNRNNPPGLIAMEKLK